MSPRRYDEAERRPATFKVTAIASTGSTASSSANVVIANSAAASTQPSPTLRVTQNVDSGQALSGSVSWTATPTGLQAASVEFYVDGRHAWTENVAPYVYGGDGRTLDTRTLANGSHTLEVRATLVNGSSRKVALGLDFKWLPHPGQPRASAREVFGERLGQARQGSREHFRLYVKWWWSRRNVRDGQREDQRTRHLDRRPGAASRMEFFIDSKMMWTE